MMPRHTMSLDERRKHLRAVRRQYLEGGRKAKRQLLDEVEAVKNPAACRGASWPFPVTRLHRESLIRLMKGRLQREPRRRQRGKARGS